MDTDARQFDEDFYAFRVVIRELERRLAAIIIQVRGRGSEQQMGGKHEMGQAGEGDRQSGQSATEARLCMACMESPGAADAADGYELMLLVVGLHTQAFDDCTTISMTFKLLDSFEGLLDREVGGSEYMQGSSCVQSRLPSSWLALQPLLSAHIGWWVNHPCNGDLQQ
jgi:hypothetical protein